MEVVLLSLVEVVVVVVVVVVLIAAAAAAAECGATRWYQVTPSLTLTLTRTTLRRW